MADALTRQGHRAGRRREVASRQWAAQVRQWLHRAVGSDGHERHTLALIGKSALAATLSWLIANSWLHASSPAFAPFSAVLIMQVTVYQSLVQATRYVLAVAAGVAVQVAVGYLLGPGVATFAVVAVVAMTIGQWRRLGGQGSQVVTAAFFAYSTYVSATGIDRLSQLATIVVLVLAGAATGVLVNVVILPPMRYRSAEYGIQALAHTLCDLISDMYPALREDALDRDRTEQWQNRAARLGPQVAQAQSAVHTAWESVFYNPRQLLPGRRTSTSFRGYQAVIDALERVSHQVASMTRSLHQWHDHAGTGAEHWGFLRHYGDFLASMAELTEAFSALTEERLREQAADLCRAAGDAQQVRQELADYTDASALSVIDPSRPYGVLMAEATRLMDEAQYTCDVLQDAVDRETAR